jgi:hypothetical protein
LEGDDRAVFPVRGDEQNPTRQEHALAELGGRNRADEFHPAAGHRGGQVTAQVCLVGAAADDVEHEVDASALERGDQGGQVAQPFLAVFETMGEDQLEPPSRDGAGGAQRGHVDAIGRAEDAIRCDRTNLCDCRGQQATRGDDGVDHVMLAPEVGEHAGRLGVERGDHARRPPAADAQLGHRRIGGDEVCHHEDVRVDRRQGTLHRAQLTQPGESRVDDPQAGLERVVREIGPRVVVGAIGQRQPDVPAALAKVGHQGGEPCLHAADRVEGGIEEDDARTRLRWPLRVWAWALGGHPPRTAYDVARLSG